MKPSSAMKEDVRAVESYGKALDSNNSSCPAETSRQSIRLRKSIEDLVLVNNSKSCLASSASPDPGPLNGSAVVRSRISLPEQEIDFAELDDGTLVEMIEDPNNAANSIFAICENGTVRHAPTVEHEDRVLVPVPREQGIFKHVRLPRGAQPCSSAAELLGGIAALIFACIDISVDDASLIAAFVISSWFIENVPVAPYLALVGPPRSGKTSLLQVLNSVCRRPLLTADITSAGFYEVYEKLSPTLPVDETLTAGNRRELFHLLKMARRVGQ